MPTINQLSQLNQLSGSDQLPVYSASNGDARKASLSTLLAYIEAQFVSPDYVTQYASPNVNGTNVQVASTTASTWLVITPTGPFATMTITLPAAAQIADGTELLVFCQQSVSALALSLNGANAAFGAPTALAANSSFKLRYNAASQAWYIAQNTTTVTQGIWTPSPTLAVPAVNTTFAGRYTQVANQVTLEFSFTLAAASSFAFTTATDYFTGLPLGLMPPTNTGFVGTPLDGWQLAVAFLGGQWRAALTKSGSPTFTAASPPAAAGTQYRFVATYLI
jgi:hypothetical protein